MTPGDPGQSPRSLAAAEMRALIAPRLADYGITRVANVTHLDRVGVPVHVAMRPTGRSLSNGSGKGVTDDAAWVSATMEAIEQAHWECADVTVRRATARELIAEGTAFAAPERLPSIADGFQSPDVAVSWSPVDDIVRGAPAWVPTTMIRQPERGRCSRLDGVLPSTNGLASGSRYEDALLAALTELIERDAVAIAAAEGRSTPTAIDRAMEIAGDLAARLEVARVGLSLFDDTTDDIGIPTCRAVVTDLVDDRIGRFFGFGAALDGEVAIVRAITEALQGRCVVIAGARDDIFEVQRRAAHRLARHAPPPIDTTSGRVLHGISTGSVEGDLDAVLHMLAGAGFDRVLVHRYTEPDDPITVVRAIVPGLEGYPFPAARPGERARIATSSSA